MTALPSLIGTVYDLPSIVTFTSPVASSGTVTINLSSVLDMSIG